MKNKIKYLIIIMLIACSIPMNSFCKTAVDTAISDGDKFIEKAKDTSTVVDTEELKYFSEDIFNMILAIGMVVAVAVGSILGIKFMLSSVEEKAKIKEILTVYIIGCVVLFGAYTIWRIVIYVLGKV